MITRYRKRISGPLMDRIDIHIDVPRIEFEKLHNGERAEPSASIRQRVEAARKRQEQRLAESDLQCNADMGPAEVREQCRLDEAGTRLMQSAMAQMNLSARSFHRILKLSRTIADLAGEEQITTQHLAEALQYRPKPLI